MKLLLLIAGCSLLLSSFARADSPVRIGLEKSVNPYTHMPQQKIHVQSVTDQVTIRDITVNRGHCAVYEKMVSHPIFPVTLVYGKTLVVTPQGTCEILEINVVTSQGNWLVKY